MAGSEILCMHCKKVGVIPPLYRAPVGWGFIEERVDPWERDEPVTPAFIYACSKTCADAIWQTGPGQPYGAHEPGAVTGRCDLCGTHANQPEGLRTPTGWLFVETTAEDGEYCIVCACSKACADAMWLLGPGEPFNDFKDGPALAWRERVCEPPPRSPSRALRDVAFDEREMEKLQTLAEGRGVPAAVILRELVRAAGTRRHEAEDRAR